jgi:D-galactose 1-dehydrogenase
VNASAGQPAPIRIALVGCGMIGRARHLPAIGSNPHFALVALVDPLAAPAGLPCYPDLATALASGLQLDAVAIATPPQTRVAVARQAIAAGLSVLLEKPPAPSVAAARALTMQAAAAGTSLFAAWHSRYAPMLGQAQAWLQGHSLSGGRMSWREDAAKWHSGQEWLWQEGGLGVFDPGINGLSLLTCLQPGPWNVHSARFEIPADAATPLAAQLELRCGACVLPAELDFRATDGETWRLELQRDDGQVAVLDRGGARWQPPAGQVMEAEDQEYAGMYRYFAELIRGARSEVDLGPLQLVEDAFAVAQRVLLDSPHP